MKSGLKFAILLGSTLPPRGIHRESTLPIIGFTVPCRLTSSNRPCPGCQTQGNGRALLLRRLERQDREIHLTKLLKTEFADRKPVWGWRDDTVEIMQKQIDYCADHDIAFWAFDWYYPEGKTKTTPLQQRPGIVPEGPELPAIEVLPLGGEPCWFPHRAEGLGCLLREMDRIIPETHPSSIGRPAALDLLLARRIAKSLRRRGRGPQGIRLVAGQGEEGGTAGRVHRCLHRAWAEHLADLARSGYTILTGYNYNGGWMNGGGSQPFRKLIEDSDRIFDQFAEETPLPYVPVITAGWDRRPWEKGQLPPEKMSVWYPDRTPKLVEEFVRHGVRWLDKHPDKATPQRLLLDLRLE